MTMTGDGARLFLRSPRRRAAGLLAAAFVAAVASNAGAADLALEKDELKFGFIKLTDMAPLAIARE
jgi:nitrate/nitrite transport system substrate-binding protein